MKFDIGLVWARWMAIWGQVSMVAGVIQFLATLVILYTVTISPKYSIPAWLYGVVVLILLLLIILFVTRWGISGYYRFFNRNSKIIRPDY